MTTDNAPEQLRAAIQVLENVAANRALMTCLSPEEYARLHKAAGKVFLPDPREKRRFVKARIRQHKLDKVQREQTILNRTGIRELRRRPVFTTPNPLPAPSMHTRPKCQRRARSCWALPPVPLSIVCRPCSCPEA